MTCPAPGCRASGAALKGPDGGVCRVHLALVPRDLRALHSRFRAQLATIAAWPRSSANDIALRMAEERFAAVCSRVREVLVRDDVPPDLALFLGEVGLDRDGEAAAR